MSAESARHIYENENGTPVLAKVRHPGKRFEWQRPGPDDKWQASTGGIDDLPLFRLPEVLGAIARGQRVYVVEGEKDVDTLRELGLTATTIGSASARPNQGHLAVLKGACAVTVIADNDKPGIEHALAWAASLAEVGVKASVLRSPLAIPKGADISDHLNAGLGLDDLIEVSATPAKRARITSRLASEVKPLAIEWLWPGYIPLGMVTMLEGPPGVGKSTLGADLMARLTTGAEAPVGGHLFTASSVAYLSDEDDTARIVVPRLIAAGADTDRVHLDLEVGLGPPDDQGATDRVRLDEHQQLLRELIVEHRLRMIIIDPLSSYLGQHNINSEQDMRDVLDSLGNIAAETGCAIVLVRHHKKSQTGDAKTQGGGSIGITAVARSLLMVDRDPSKPPDSGWCVIALGKSNIAPPNTQSIAFQLAGAEVGDGIETSRIEWGGPTDVSADELLELRAEKSTDRTLIAETEDMIIEVLMEHGGSVASNDLQTAIVDKDVVSEQTFVRARASLKKAGRVESKQVNLEGKRRWEWHLTDKHLFEEVNATKTARESVGHGPAGPNPLPQDDQLSTTDPHNPKSPELSGASGGSGSPPDALNSPVAHCATEGEVTEEHAFDDVLGGGTEPAAGEREVR